MCRNLDEHTKIVKEASHEDHVLCSSIYMECSEEVNSRKEQTSGCLGLAEGEEKGLGFLFGVLKVFRNGSW